MDLITPIFILSLPRSGSTLLQRILASPLEIDTIAESWILLPYFMAMEERTTYAEYGQMTLHVAFKNLIDGLPDGLDDYYEAVQRSALILYERMATREARYFVDKTPRYHLISDHIFHTFPNAKFIFLWRNPLSVAASLFTMSSARGSWKDYHRYKVDLYKGFDRLFQSFAIHGECGLTLKYEDLVTYPEHTMKKLSNFLGVQFTQETLDAFFSHPLRGSLGDQKGTNLYEGISTQSVNKWKQTLSVPIRKRWAIRYLNWIGEARLNQIGYDYETLLREVKTLQQDLRYTMMDGIEYIFYHLVYSIIDPTIIKYKIRQIRAGKRTYPLY